MTPGYSQTPLIKKLGYKPGFRVLWQNTPAEYPLWLGELPSNCYICTEATGAFQLIHFFSDSQQTFQERLPMLMAHLSPAGMLWVSWPKKASRVPTDLSEDVIREAALAAGLVDIKVCAVSEVWSGLKLVYRKKDRHLITNK